MISGIRKINNGILLSLLSTFCFSVGNVLTKYISNDVPFTEIAFFRSFIGLVLVSGYMFNNGYTFKATHRKILFLRGLLGGSALLCSFYAISKIKLGEVSILFQLSPVFVVVFANIILKEKLPKFFYILLISSLIGCVLVIKPSFSSFGNFASFISVLGAILIGLAYVCIRALSKEHKTHMIVLYFSFTASIVALPWIRNFIMPSLNQWLVLMGIGLAATFAQFFMTKAYSVEKAGIVSMVSYVGLFLNVSWGMLIWKEYLDLYSLIGGVLILASCLILSLKVYNQKKHMVPVSLGD